MESGRTSVSTTADAIMDYIRTNRLNCGDPLPTEMQLCAELKVSRSSVREAMRLLSSLDIVEVRHGYGTYVGAMSLAPLINGMIFRIVLGTERSHESLRNVVNTRIALDIHLTDELITIHQGKEHDELYALVDQMQEQFEKGESFAEQDFTFHSLLLKDISNELISELATAFWEIHTRVVPMLGLSNQGDLQETVDAHRDIVKALEEGDREGYLSAVHRHYQPLLRNI